MRTSDWSSDVYSSDLPADRVHAQCFFRRQLRYRPVNGICPEIHFQRFREELDAHVRRDQVNHLLVKLIGFLGRPADINCDAGKNLEHVGCAAIFRNARLDVGIQLHSLFLGHRDRELAIGQLGPHFAPRLGLAGGKHDRIPLNGPTDVERSAYAEKFSLVIERVNACQRSEEHTSELQSLMRTSYAVFCLKNKNTTHQTMTY